MRGRGDRLEALLADKEVDELLVTDLTNVRYLTGFGGTNGACVVGAGKRVFLTDFRYTERAAAEVEGWDPVTVDGDWLAGIVEHLGADARVGFEDDHMSVRSRSRFGEAVGEGNTLVECGGLVEKLRRIKDESELSAIAAAAELADEAYAFALGAGLRGKSERAVALATENHIRELGGEPSFETIVAGGPNGALPHAEPGDRIIEAGDLVVFDMGAKLDGYCSDCTRTFAVGEPPESSRIVYDIVLEAQLASVAAVRSGAPGKDVDAVARRIIEGAGHGDRFGHGLGHGVGLEVHEGPRLSARSDDVLATGEVVTVEPGIYLPGDVGVRIEDLVVVTDTGHHSLSGLDKALTIVD